MGAKVTFDTANRLMIVTEAPVLAPGEIVAKQTLDIEIDFYSDAKEDWEANVGGNFRKNLFLFLTAESAGSALPGGQVEPAFFRLLNDHGWRLLPYDVDHELTLIGNIVPNDETLPIFAPRSGRSILIFRDGSQVAQMTTTTVGQVPEIQSIDLKTDLIAFQGGVAYDVLGFSGNGIASNGHEIGTRSAPSNDLDVVVNILNDKGLNEIFLTSSVISVGTDFSIGYRFVGDSRLFTFVNFDLANIEKCEFFNVTLSNILDRFLSVRLCNIETSTNVSGSFHQCYFKGSISIVGETTLTECYAKATGFIIIPGSSAFTFNDFHGPVTISGMTGNVSIIEIYGGTVTVDNTCTGGTLTVIGGPYELIDNSNGTIVIDNTGDIKTSGTFQNSQNDTKRIEEMHGQITRSVFIDTENLVNGDGYQQTPFNNFTDAVDYAETNGLKHLVILADATIDRLLKNFVITGIGTPTIDTNGQNLDKSEILRCGLIGLYTGRIVAQECNVVGLFTLNGFFETCAISADVVVPDGGLALVKGCNSFVTGFVPPSVDVGGVGGTGQLVVTGFDGGITIKNVNQVADNVKFLSHAGRIIVDASCTQANNINLGGISRFIDNSPGQDVNNQLIDPIVISETYTRLGLEKGNPFTDTPSQFSDDSGDIVMTVTGDGVNTTTVTRQ